VLAPSRARPPRSLPADTGRADSPSRAGAAPEGGSSPAHQAAAAPRAEEARAPADAGVSVAPDFAFAAVGYRAWQLAPGGVLFPLALPAAPPWEPAVNRAHCFAGRVDAHAAPASHCTCGLHALHAPHDGRLKLGHPAVGAIAAWGEIEVYAEGFRAEYASVIALAQPSRSAGPLARLRQAAQRYGVRLVSLADLEAEAREFALPLPDEVLPKRQAGPNLARAATTDDR
jgi:hypothetical protein